MKLRVTSIQRGCVYDGPGVRTTVFLKGCTMSCPWCCNPETISPQEEYYIDDTKCLRQKGISSKLCELCSRNNGSRSLSECPFGVAESVSTDYTPEELFELLSKDFAVMRSSGGGVTFSGGEPLFQIEGLEPLLQNLKKEEIHIAFETTLISSENTIRRAFLYADLIILDLKLQPEHSLYNSAYIENIRRRIYYCRKEDITIKFRMVFIESMLDVIESIEAFLRSVDVDEIEVLMCHKLGVHKYLLLNKTTHNICTSKNSFDIFTSVLEENNFKVMKLSI